MQDTIPQQSPPAGVTALRRAEALSDVDRASVLYALCVLAPEAVLPVLDNLDALEAAGGNGAQR
jgi:hypothetical protein